MPPELAEVARWLLKARHDWSVARKILAAPPAELDAAAFHCQQAIEKTLKAYLVYRATEFEKTHDLGRLLELCSALDGSFESLRHAVAPLTQYAVVLRYPGPADPTERDVQQALHVVADVWDFVTAHMPSDVVP
jgi:HEPN domain-containing protein